ncbi:DUF7344 domain-containing protein [Halosimplex sp. J119]
MDSQHTSSDPDALFELLADPRRRRLLEVLEETGRGERAPLADLSERVAVAEGTTEGEARHGVAVALHHVHLPKLDEAGLVEYDPETRVVETTDRSAAAAGRLVTEE